jgi:formate-dependent nitrite reductase membrane component NrfD
MNDKSGRIRDESSVHALKIKEVDTRIESEIAGLRSLIATVSGTFTASVISATDLLPVHPQAKINVLQYLVGVATGAAALLLAYLRMFK